MLRRVCLTLASCACLVAGCAGQSPAPSPAPSTVTVPTTVVSRSTATVVSTVTYDPSAAAASSSAAAASSVAAAGGAEFQAQMAAAGITYPTFEQARTYCVNMDAGKEPFHGYSGVTLNFDTTVSVATDRELKALQITIATLCPQHQAGLDAAIQKKADAAASVSAAAAARSQVTYTVSSTGSESALITYAEDANFNIAQENGAALPWTKDLTIPPGGRILSLSAQNSGGGDITCSIAVGGQVVDTATSSGDYAVVTCSG